ncbi:MAG: M56 family metallopeptidase [Polaribacter sp.]
MINYIIQVVLFQVLFLAIYDLFLSKETFFTKNRWYLLSTPMLSFLIPFIKIPMFQKAVPQEYIVYLPEIILSPEKVILETNWYQSIHFMDAIFGVGVIIFSVLFISKMYQVVLLIFTYKKERKKNYTLIMIPKETKAFSFFNYIFLGKDISEHQKEKIIEHELVHSKQKHTFDLLFFEVLKIIMWFNPMIYLYQKRITLVHEYISDSIATKTDSKENYINTLLSNFFQVENIAFINQFYKNTLIKKRIMMMTKKQSKKMNQLKYLVLIPVLASMLFYTSCSENEVNELILNKKEISKTYFNRNGDIKETIGKKETYFDSYFGIGDDYITPKGKEVAIKDLSVGEKEEFNRIKSKIDSFSKAKESKSFIDLKVFNYKNQRKVIVLLPDFSKMKNNNIKTVTETEEVSFMVIDKVPTFPGCEEGDKACFSKMIQKHFAKEFNSELPKTLGLEPGRKRVFIGFKIDKQGNVVDIKTRAPHIKIKDEVIKVMSSLPRMQPGEHKGQKVGVKYSIPFTIFIEE